MRVYVCFLLYLLMIGSFGCQPKQINVKDYLKGWEYITTYESIPATTILVKGKESKIITGSNDVLIVMLERKPLFKPGKELTDFYSKRTLIIELNSVDSIVRPNNLGRSKILRGVFSMSPDYGVNPLAIDENILIRKTGLKQWSIFSDLSDFKFEGKFSFRDSSSIVNKHQELFRD